ncbi:MAG: hypothetical protein ACKOQP_05840, partial [Bacteroidota bacterium]
MDVGFGCEVELDFCETVGVGGIFATQLDVYWSNFAGSGINTFYFDFIVIDIDDYKIVQKDDVNFYDCANDCGKIQTITGLDNPSDAPLDITFNDPLNGYSYYVDNVLLTPVAGVYSFTIPARSTVQLQMANPGCTITTEIPFTLLITYCGLTTNIDIQPIIVQCGDCGIDCDGITVSSLIRQGLILDPTLDDPTQWLTQINFGNPTNSISGGKFTLLGGNVGAYNESALLYDSPITFPTTSPQTFRYTIKTGRWQDVNNSNLLYMYLPGGGWGANIEIAGVPFSLPTIQPFSTYTGTFTINPWTAPPFGFGNGPVLVVRVANQNTKYFDILEFNVEIETEIQTANVDCSDLDTYNQSAIGDGKLATYSLYYRNGFADGTELFFNPKLYGDTCDFQALLGQSTIGTVPPQGWKLVVNSLWIGDGQPHFFTLYGLGATGLTQQNLLVWAEFVTAYEFKIKFAFYVTMDVDDWIKNITLNNQYRLLRSQWNNPSPLVNNIQSVYTVDKSLCSMIVIRDSNYTITLPLTGIT